MNGTLKVTATGFTHVKYFPYKKYKRASTSSTSPYNSHCILRVCTIGFFGVFFFFWIKHVGYLLSLPSQGTIVGILVMC